jgi:hypothetical protein
MYVGGTLVGIFSKDSFTPKNEITGFTGSILPGFNGANIANLRLNARAVDSDKLDGKSSDLFVTKDTDNIINGTLSLTDNLGLLVGSTPGNGQFIIQDGDLVIANTASDRDIRLVVRSQNVLDTAVSIESLAKTINFYAGQPTSIVRTGGDMIVDGDLTVNGTTTSVNSSVLLIEDKNIELAKTSSPTDTNADGGGLILKGTTDHTLLWSNARDAWESSEHINLNSGKSYKINNVVVIDENGLGPGITSAPGITSFGVQSELTVDDLFLNDNIIESTPINSSIILKPNGTGSVNLSNKRITNLLDPSADQDASTKNYTDFTIRGMSLIFSIDTTGLTNADIANYLTILAPPVQYRNGTEARLLCVQYTNNSVPLNINSLIQTSTVQVTTTSPVGSANVLTNITFTDTESGIPGGQITIPAQDIPINRFIKIFRIQAGVWTNIS